MLLAHAVLVVYVASNAVPSAAAPPLEEKVYYDLENAANLFKEHVQKYERKYDNDEYIKRFEIFKETLISVNELNSESSQAVFEVNFFADLTPDEKESYFGFVPPPSNNGSIAPVFPSGFEAPDKLDWRERGAVSHVKSQGQCGSCYIFSAYGCIEGQYAIKHKQCLALSEQQSLDCFEDCTCYGGTPHLVMLDLTQDPDGCMLEKDYPYTAKKSTCKQRKSESAPKVLNGIEIVIHDEESLKKSLAQHGPLSVALIGTPILEYKKGIFTQDCTGTVNHGVTLVGYGEENGTKYWIIKNSWGEDWGEGGYIRLQRGVDKCQMGTSYTALAVVA